MTGASFRGFQGLALNAMVGPSLCMLVRGKQLQFHVFWGAVKVLKSWLASVSGYAYVEFTSDDTVKACLGM